MDKKFFKLFKLVSFIIILNLVFTSCEKDLYEQQTDTSFSPQDAKDWYYSNLKKSPQFKSSRKSKDDKLPDWKHSTYRKTGEFEIIEFPLMKSKKTVMLAQNNSISMADTRRVLDATLTRVVFIKEGNSKMELRELNYIPDYRYLASKSFDISGVDLSKEKNDFTGTLIIKNWDATIIAIHIMAQGKILKSSINKQKKKKTSNVARTTGIICAWYEDVEYQQDCTYIHEGDSWNPTDDCTDWVPTGNVSAPYEVCTDDGTGCTFSADPNCECTLYGIGCDTGGGGTPPAPVLYINDQVLKDNPCLNEVYSKLGNASGFDFYLKRFDGSNSVADLKFDIGSLGLNTFGETSLPNSLGQITITLDAVKLMDSPSLLVADIFIHEIIHAEMFRKLMIAAENNQIDPTNMTQQQQKEYVDNLQNNFPGLYDYYMRYEYKVPSGQEPSNAQHELMAQHYISIIVSALKQYDSTQTNDVYNAIAWLGLKGTGTPDPITGLLPNSTIAWKNLSKQDRLNLIQTLKDFKNNSPKCQN